MALETIFFSIALLLFSAQLFGKAAERIGVAPLVGQLIAGIVVGPVLGIVQQGMFLTDFLTISIIFLLLMAGLEIKFSDIRRYTYSASILAFLGGFISFLLGFFVGMAFFNDLLAAFAIGTALVSTSNITLFMFLTRTGEFNSKIGRLIVAVTIADDVVGILFLSVFSFYVRFQSVTFSNIFFLLLVSIGFYFMMFTAGSRIVDIILNAVSKFLDENILFTVPVAFAFLLAYISDNIGITLATGAFLAGMAIANSQYSESVIAPKIITAAQSFIIPLFYAIIGSILVISNLDFLLIAFIILAAVLGKLIGVGLMSRLYGVRGYHQRLMGIMLIPRGNENVAIVQIMLLLGVLTFQVYTSLLFAMVATILITPVLLKLFYKK